MGVKRFLTLSDGSFIESLEARLKSISNKIVHLQRRIKHKIKGSNNIKKAYLKLVLLHKRKPTSGTIFCIKSQPYSSKATT